MVTSPRPTAKGFQDERYRGLVLDLVDARKRLGLSQDALAKRLARHQQFVSRYETGERRLDMVEFIDIATALGCDLMQMIHRATPSAGRSDSAKS